MKRVALQGSPVRIVTLLTVACGVFRTARAIAATALLGSLLAGCAHNEVAEDGLSYDDRRVRLDDTANWRMNGRIAVNTGTQAFQGQFQWRQSGDEVELTVRNPVGMNVLNVSGPPDRLMVRAGGETRELSDPEPELSALLGWWLPVRSLNAWLLGYPDPGFPWDQELGPAGTSLRTMEQRLWRLTYDSYRIHEGVLIPRRIDLAHEAIELRVIVDGWQPSS